MKRCPECNRTFDDTLTFCLIDGSILDAPFDPAAGSGADRATAEQTEVLTQDRAAGIRPTLAEDPAHEQATVVRSASAAGIDGLGQINRRWPLAIGVSVATLIGAVSPGVYSGLLQLIERKGNMAPHIFLDIIWYEFYAGAIMGLLQALLVLGVLIKARSSARRTLTTAIISILTSSVLTMPFVFSDWWEMVLDYSGPIFLAVYFLIYGCLQGSVLGSAFLWARKD